MNSHERRKKIIEELRKNKSVYISDLAKIFDTSTMTIRRDLNKLAELNIVTLIHGGAVLNEGMMAIPTVAARVQQMPIEKSKIAQYCASLIREGNAIYLDTGSTTIEIAEELRTRQNISVLTHSLSVQNILSSAEKIKLFIMPGVYDKVCHGAFGDMTCRAIRTFSLDIGFLGVAAIDIANGITSADISDQSVKMAILERANKKIAVFDHTKIGKIKFAQVCPINALDVIVTDKAADEDFVNKARKRGVKVVQI